ncbi:MAG TPA: 7-carboxy-7-deazaguanine synthase [Polyangiaceae bacterium]|nr:7-carboxy-7-deazaguanine synthase [Polyangiaceae bacterium]
MAYLVKEIFLTLQGEGANTGRPAVFCRFAGCNLWSGRTEDRHKGPGGCSRWCDTDFVGTNGSGGGRFQNATDLAASIRRAWTAPLPKPPARPLVVCTGGEPLLQLDVAAVSALHVEGFEIAVETNGTIVPPQAVDWLCVSPKTGAQLLARNGSELKLIFPQDGIDPAHYEDLDFRHFFLQPMDGPEAKRNTKLTVQYCLDHPKWRLSLQTHKLLGIA